MRQRAALPVFYILLFYIFCGVEGLCLQFSVIPCKIKEKETVFVEWRLKEEIFCARYSD